jgi:predicted dehydrogenase
MKTIKFGIIGCGSRLRSNARDLLPETDIVFAGGWDPEPEHVERLVKELGGKVYGSYQELLADPDINWVFIGSPNAFHREHAVAAFEAGKNVFCEKPLATSIEDCVAINDANDASGKQFATGFVLRYSPIYRRVKQLLDSGDFGRIISVDANENIDPAHGAYIMTNWRRHAELAGSHILEKCVHDLDLLNWFTGSKPSRVAAFGGNDMWTSENNGLLDRADYSSWIDKPKNHTDVKNPFTSDKSVEDNVVAVLEYQNGARAQFQATMSNALPERRMYFSCTKGNVSVELYSKTIRFRTVGDATEHIEVMAGDFHGGGDQVQAAELAECMRDGTPPKAGGTEGLLSAVVGCAINDARLSHKVIELEDTWKKLGV